MRHRFTRSALHVLMLMASGLLLAESGCAGNASYDDEEKPALSQPPAEEVINLGGSPAAAEGEPGQEESEEESDVPDVIPPVSVSSSIELPVAERRAPLTSAQGTPAVPLSMQQQETIPTPIPETMTTSEIPTASSAQTFAPVEKKEISQNMSREAVVDRTDYILGSGDKLKITVFEEPSLSGEFEVTGEGNVSYPLIGNVPARGLTLKKFGDLLTQQLQDGYIKEPKVTIEVMGFRHFFIMGEVNKPGNYPYAADLNVLNAVATAGGYTYRARESSVTIRRNHEEIEAGADDRVMPGDTIIVHERYF